MKINECKKVICEYSMDTYIEERFYELTRCSEKKRNIFDEWKICKNFYEKNTNLINYDFQHYSLHDKTHSIAILDSIELFLGQDRIDKLGIGDLWLLLNCAYAHDIGMVIYNDDIIEFWKEDSEFSNYVKQEIQNENTQIKGALKFYKQLDSVLRNINLDEENDYKYDKLFQIQYNWPITLRTSVNLIMAEYVRRKHAEKCRKFMDQFAEKNKGGITENRLYNLIGDVCSAHGKDYDFILEELPYEVIAFGKYKVHPQFVASMVCLGDLFDLDNNRFDDYQIKHYGELPASSAIHLKKHKSITEFNITSSVIRVIARSDDYEVCRECFRWFKCIEDTVRNTVSNWNLIIPEEIGGCIFNSCVLKIYYKNHEIKGGFDNRNFEVDKTKLLKLVIGKNIYDTEWIFVREYLQNALDATKVAIWNNVQSNTLDYFLKGKPRKELTPFDFPQNYLDSFRIDVEVSFLSEETAECEEYIRIIIRDHGIGMDEECVNAISVIGKGWHGRKDYRDTISSMPPWMKPTGGFGIGLQSAFMITDKIIIQTKSVKENIGRKITLISPEKDSSISEVQFDKSNNGTEVIIDIPIHEVLTNRQIQEYFKEAKKHEDAVSFEYKTLIDTVTEYLAWYINRVLPDSWIPIRVYNTIAAQSSNDGKIESFLYGNSITESRDLVQVSKTSIFTKSYKSETGITLWHVDSQIDYEEKMRYYFDESEKRIILWDQIGEAYVQLALSKKNDSKTIFCFKNVLIPEEKKTMMKECYDFVLDFMGIKTRSCLNVSRNSFAPQFKEKTYLKSTLKNVSDLHGYIYKYIRFYLKILCQKELSYSTEEKRNLLLLMMCASEYYGYEEEYFKYLETYCADGLTGRRLISKTLEEGERKEESQSQEYVWENVFVSPSTIYRKLYSSIDADRDMIIYISEDQFTETGLQNPPYIRNDEIKFSDLKKLIENYGINSEEYNDDWVDYVGNKINQGEPIIADNFFSKMLNTYLEGIKNEFLCNFEPQSEIPEKCVTFWRKKDDDKSNSEVKLRQVLMQLIKEHDDKNDNVKEPVFLNKSCDLGEYRYLSVSEVPLSNQECSSKDIVILPIRVYTLLKELEKTSELDYETFLEKCCSKVSKDTREWIRYSRIVKWTVENQKYRKEKELGPSEVNGLYKQLGALMFEVTKEYLSKKPKKTT